jgi:hypothetical protein
VINTRFDLYRFTSDRPSVLRCFRKQYLWFKREVFMNLLDMVKGQMTDSVMQQLGAASGLGAGDVSKAMGAIIPTQLSAIVKHGSTPQGAEGLMGMLSNLGSMGNLGDFAGMLGQSGGAANIAKIGSSLLPSLFGNQLGGIVSALASATGLGSGPLNALMGMAGPLVMGQLGKAVTGGGLNAAGLASMLGGMAPQVNGMLPAGLGNILGSLGGLGALGGLASGAMGNLTGAAGNIAGAATGALGNVAGDAAKAAGALGAAGAGLAGAATSGLGGAVSGAASSLGSVAAPAAAKGGMGWLIPAILGVLAVGGLAWFFGRPAAPAPVAETPAVEAPATETPAADTMASGSAMAECTKTYSLGVKDGDTVTNNFPFGGEGEGKGYKVTVTRLDVQPRVIGTKMLPLDAECKFGYDSIPGKGKVQYDVRPIDAAADSTPIQTLTVTVN